MLTWMIYLLNSYTPPIAACPRVEAKLSTSPMSCYEEEGDLGLAFLSKFADFLDNSKKFT